MQKLNLLNLDWSPDWSTIVGKKHPLIVEIGFGNGDFLVHLAKTNPDHNIIGFEVSNQSIGKAERKIKSNKLSNARVVHARGESALAHLLEPQSVTEFHINYPDPWFKKRHVGRRLIQSDTLDYLASRLVEGGLLYLATDIRDYAEMCHELLSRHPALDNTFDMPWVDAIEGRVITKYEQKGYREGRPGHYFRYHRNAETVQHLPVIKDYPMPHLFFKTSLSALDIVEQFEKQYHKFGDTHITVLYAYANPKTESVLFEVILLEPTIEQHIALLLNQQRDGEQYVLQLSSIGLSRPTQGVHQAVAFLGDYLASQHPDAQVTDRKLKVE